MNDPEGNIYPPVKQLCLMLLGVCQKSVFGNGKEGRRVLGLLILRPLCCPFSNHSGVRGRFSLRPANMAGEAVRHHPARCTELHIHFQMGANLLPHLQEGLGYGWSLNPALKGCRRGCTAPLVEKHTQLYSVCLPLPLGL